MVLLSIFCCVLKSGLEGDTGVNLYFLIVKNVSPILLWSDKFVDAGSKPTSQHTALHLIVSKYFYSNHFEEICLLKKQCIHIRKLSNVSAFL
jgi:hypothetical protein